MKKVFNIIKFIVFLPIIVPYLLYETVRAIIGKNKKDCGCKNNKPTI
jgi:hypothetical protein